MENSKITAERMSLAIVTTGLVITAFDRVASRSNREGTNAGLKVIDFIAEIVLIAVFAALVFRALNRSARPPLRGKWMWIPVGVVGAIASVALLTLRLERSMSHTPGGSRRALAAQSAQRLTPAIVERQRMKGLGKTGWAAEAEVELLNEGETQEGWRTQYHDHATMVPIVIDLDAEGNASIDERTFAPDRLRAWLADTAATFGGVDPVLLRPQAATSLASLERTAAAVLDSGWTRIHLLALADGQLQRAHSVRLHGMSVRITPNVELPDAASDSPK